MSPPGETESLAPPAGFAARARYDAGRLDAARQRFAEDPEGYWRDLATGLDWRRFPTRIKDVSFDPADFRIRWYADGELNVAQNCLDRHLASRGDQAALVWEPDDPAEPARRISYRELHGQVCQLAHALQNLVGHLRDGLLQRRGQHLLQVGRDQSFDLGVEQIQ